MAQTIDIPRRGPGPGPRRRGINIPGKENIPQVQVARDPGVRIPPGAFGVGIGETLSQAGAQIADFGARLLAKETRIRNKNEFNTAMLGFRNDLISIENELEEEPDFRSLESKTQTAIQQRIEQRAKSISNDETRSEFETSAGIYGIPTLKNSRLIRRARELDESLKIGLQLEESGLQSLAANPAMSVEDRNEIALSVANYYADLANEQTLPQDTALEIVQAFKNKAGTIMFDHDKKVAIRDGGPDAIAQLTGNIRNGSYGIKPENIEREIESFHRDYVRLQNREEKISENEEKARQETNYLNMLTLMHDPNRAHEVNYDTLNKAIQSRDIKKEDAEKVFKMLDKTAREESKVVTEPGVKVDLFSRITTRDGTPSEMRKDVIEAFTNNFLTDTDTNSLLLKITEWESSLQNDTDKKTDDGIKNLSQAVKARIRTTGPFAQFVKQDEEEFIVVLTDLGAARIKSGENWFAVWQDFKRRINNGELSFDRGTIEDAMEITKDPNDPGFEVAAQRVALFREQEKNKKAQEVTAPQSPGAEERAGGEPQDKTDSSSIVEEVKNLTKEFIKETENFIKGLSKGDADQTSQPVPQEQDEQEVPVEPVELIAPAPVTEPDAGVGQGESVDDGQIKIPSTGDNTDRELIKKEDSAKVSQAISQQEKLETKKKEIKQLEENIAAMGANIKTRESAQSVVDSRKTQLAMDRAKLTKDKTDLVSEAADIDVKPDIAEMIFDISSKHKIPLYIVARIAMVESLFDQNAVSPKGAIGVMQIMQATGRDFGASRHDLFAPQKNIETFGKIYASLIAKYQRHFSENTAMVMTLAAYNAGQGRVDTAIERADNKSAEEIISRLPDETRNYVRKILKLPDTWAEPRKTKNKSKGK